MGLVLASDYTDRAALLRSINLFDVSSGDGFSQAKSKAGFMPIGNLLVIPKDLEAYYQAGLAVLVAILAAALLIPASGQALAAARAATQSGATIAAAEAALTTERIAGTIMIALTLAIITFGVYKPKLRAAPQAKGSP